MDRNLFDLNTVRKLVNSHKKFVRPISAKKLKELQRNNKSFRINNSSEFKYPTFPISGLQKILEVCFFATLKKEEGRFHKFSVLINPLEECFRQDFKFKFPHKPFVFKQRLAFNVENITKLSTTLHNTSNYIEVVFDDKGEPKILGFDDTTHTSLQIESLDVGKLSICIQFANVSSPIAIIDGKNINFWDDSSKKISDLITHVLYQSLIFERDDYDDLIKEIYRHEHGGILIFVPNGNQWKKSIQQPTLFSPINKFAEIKNWAKKRCESQGSEEKTGFEYGVASDRVENCLKTLSQLTALDGATLVTKDFEVIAFGAKIKPVNSKRRPDEIVILDPFEKVKTIKFDNLGGTRHQSSAQFIFDQKDAVAVVFSQDKKISIMFWDKNIQKVTAIQHAEYEFLSC